MNGKTVKLLAKVAALRASRPWGGRRRSRDFHYRKLKAHWKGCPRALKAQVRRLLKAELVRD